MRVVVAAVTVMALCLAGGGPVRAQSRDQVWAAGSSTVFPFAARVAETFARKTGRKTPRIESLGTGGGIKLFCSGVGSAYPDIATASRPMKRSEFDACAAKGVRDIVELKVGYDGIVIAGDKRGAAFDFRPEHLYLALAADVPRYGKLVGNPYETWPQIARGLPAGRIEVYGPPPTSGTRDAFVELAMEGGAAKLPLLKRLKADDDKAFKARVGTMRRDGAWIDAGENDNAMVGTLTKTPGALGVFGYSFLEENRDRVRAATVNGVAPTPRTIADGSYPLARSLYIYVKKAHLRTTPGLQQFVREFTSDAATGRGGYLRDRGLILLPTSQHAVVKAAGLEMASMPRPDG